MINWLWSSSASRMIVTGLNLWSDTLLICCHRLNEAEQSPRSVSMTVIGCSPPQDSLPPVPAYLSSPHPLFVSEEVLMGRPVSRAGPASMSPGKCHAVASTNQHHLLHFRLFSWCPLKCSSWMRLDEDGPSAAQQKPEAEAKAAALWQ